MADYTSSSRFSAAGVGSVLLPEKWLPSLENDLPMLTFWNQFLDDTWGGEDVLNPGEGKIFKVSYLTDKAVATTPLTAGTKVPTTTQTGLTQTEGTLSEYGDAEGIENFADWASNSDMQSASGVQAGRQALRTRNALIGAAYIASPNYFTIEGTTAALINETSGTTSDGTSPMLPLHVTDIVSRLRRKGVAPFDDGKFRCIGAPGMFDAIKVNSNHSSDAASLGITGIYLSGEVMIYNSVVFIEEAGPDAVCAYGTNGTSVIFGKNALVGWDNMFRPDLIRFYGDVENDFGRASKVGWVGYFGAVRPVDASTNARSWGIYHSY